MVFEMADHGAVEGKPNLCMVAVVDPAATAITTAREDTIELGHTNGLRRSYAQYSQYFVY